MESESLHIAGLRITPYPLNHAVEMFLADARAGQARIYIFVNGQSAILRRSNAGYAAALERECVVGLVDGAAVELAGLMQGASHIERCPGPDFFAEAARRASATGLGFYLLGGTEGVAMRAAESLVAANPDLKIAGTHCPPFGVWDGVLSANLVADIRSSGAKALWLGVSAPKQEMWAVAYSGALEMPIACVGAAFDFIAGVRPRAPRWMRALRVEWLFRLLSEPRRLWYRYLVGNTVFIADALRFKTEAADEHRHH